MVNQITPNRGTEPVPTYVCTPEEINGYPVRAAVALPYREGTHPARHIVVCEKVDSRNAHTGMDAYPASFCTWEIGRQGGKWTAYWGHHDLTLEKALEDMIRRAL